MTVTVFGYSILITIDFYSFLSVFSFILVSIETAFDHIVVISTLFSVFGNVSLVFDILHQHS